MAATSSSERISGRSAPRASRALIATVLLLVLEGAAVAAMIARSHRLDLTFRAKQLQLRLAAVARHPVRPGQTIIVAAKGRLSDQVTLLEGWSVPESPGIWTDGPAAEFVIALPGNVLNRPLALRLGGVVMADRSGRQAVELSIGGSRPARRVLPGGAAELQSEIPPAPASTAGFVRATIVIAHPSAPPGGADTRRLGFKLITLAVVDPRQSRARK